MTLKTIHANRVCFVVMSGMVQANDVVRPMSRHSERTPLVLGGTQLHGEKISLLSKLVLKCYKEAILISVYLSFRIGWSSQHS